MITSDHDKAPGLSPRKRKDGSVAWYWIARNVSGRLDIADYPGGKTIRLHYATDEERAARCRILTAELREWLSGRTDKGLAFDGTLGGLIDCYQKDEDSPFRSVKWNTRRSYIQSLTLLQGGFGKRKIASLTGRDFRRWHRLLKEPREPGGPERLKRATDAMKLLRQAIYYGASVGLSGCAKAAAMLHEMRFQQPAPRRAALTYAQAEAIITAALAAGRPSVALAQALQFETSLRQRDVIGEWTRDIGASIRDVADDERRGGIWHGGARWGGGVTWGDVSRDMVLRKATTKTGTEGAWDLTRAPLVMAVLQHFQPLGERLGPMIVNERTGRPYAHWNYTKLWRQLARDAGVPDEIWNMDSRAGGITEGVDAGASANDLRLQATHSDVKITGRYMRDPLAATSRVADLRAARRERNPNKTS